MTRKTSLENIQRLIDIMALLRSEKGCEWDRQQTPETLKKHILEETYELLEAIDRGAPVEICDELGDMLLQVVFQAQIFSEAKLFTIEDVAAAISNKLIRRHPHIFADASHEGHERRWERIKQEERSARGQSESLAQRIPSSLPALKKASKALKKTSHLAPELVIDQLQTQLSGIRNDLPVKAGSRTELEQQIGEMLFSICRLALAIDVDPEDLLRRKTTQLIAEIDAKKELY